METTTLEAADTKAAYRANRTAWKTLAYAKLNSDSAYIQFIITQSINLTDKLGSDEAEAWALRKLRAAFTPSKQHGRRTLYLRLKQAKDFGTPFNMPTADNELTSRYRALATYLCDEIRMED